MSKENVYIGKLVLLGTATQQSGGRTYSVIELENSNGQIITLKDVFVDTSMTSYLNIGEVVELHTTKVSLIFGLLGGTHIYAIRTAKRNLIVEVPSAIKFSVVLNCIVGTIFLFTGIGIIFTVYLYIRAAMKQSQKNRLLATQATTVDLNNFFNNQHSNPSVNNDENQVQY